MGVMNLTISSRDRHPVTRGRSRQNLPPSGWLSWTKIQTDTAFEAPANTTIATQPSATLDDPPQAVTDAIAQPNSLRGVTVDLTHGSTFHAVRVPVGGGEVEEQVTIDGKKKVWVDSDQTWVIGGDAQFIYYGARKSNVFGSSSDKVHGGVTFKGEQWVANATGGATFSFFAGVRLDITASVAVAINMIAKVDISTMTMGIFLTKFDFGFLKYDLGAIKLGVTGVKEDRGMYKTDSNIAKNTLGIANFLGAGKGTVVP